MEYEHGPNINTTRPTFHGKPCRTCGATWRYVHRDKNCVACHARRRKESRERVKASGKHSNRSRWYWGEDYGLKNGDAEAIFVLQNRSCVICKRTDANRWNVDHCHATGKVRGILCTSCNVMLGNAKDNVQTLSNAIDYLNSNKK